MEKIITTLMATNIRRIDTKIKLLVVLSFILVFISGAKAASAASLYFSPSSGSFIIGEPFSVNVYVASAEQAMNAASGVISFPQNNLELTSLSKSGSIFSLWVQEPSFSNSAGTVNFEGIVLNPGFIGSGGKIVTLSFRGKKEGSVPLNFSSGSILANDGRGTNILTSMGSANYFLRTTGIILPGEEETAPPATLGAPLAPKVSSSTHPEEDKWYSNNDPEFSWKLPSDVMAISYAIDQNASTNPKFIAESLAEKVSFQDLEDGNWYFHINFKNQHGWGKLTHRKVLIDTVSPLPFKVDIQRKDLTDPSPVLFFNTTDELSGVEYYELKIRKEEPFLADRIKTHSFSLPPQAPGIHQIEVRAFDKAENYTLAQTAIEILPIETPIITKHSKSVMPGEGFDMEGKALLDVIVRIFLQRKGEEPQMKETKSDSDGNWVFASDPLKNGDWETWVQAQDERRALSLPSEKIGFRVGLSPFLKFGKIAIDYLTIVITLIVLIIGIIIVVFYAWYRISLWRKKLRTETKEAARAVYSAFKALKEEVEEQVSTLDRKPSLSKKEKEIRDKLKSALNVSEELIGREIRDVEKELE